MDEFCVNIEAVPLNPRHLPPAMVKQGSPRVTGRVLSMSPDSRTARVIWESTSGVLAMPANPEVTDVSFIVSGHGVIRAEGRPALSLEPGVVVEFPRTAYELEVFATLKKVSFLYCPAGLKLAPEPV